LFKTKHLEDFGYKQPYNALYLYSPETDIICFLRIVKFGIPIGTTCIFFYRDGSLFLCA